MKFSNIKERHIYTVIFDPVKHCEFNGRHLAVVLKRNNDNQTYIVMPLTSVPNGDGVNKINLGKISTLPSNLRTNDTYAVFNQIRTVNADRFIVLKDDARKPMDASISDDVYFELMHLGINDLMFSCSFEEKSNLIDNIKNRLYKKEVVRIAYEIKSTQTKLEHLTQELENLCTGMSFEFTDEEIRNGIDKIVSESLSNKAIEVVEEESAG